VEGRTRVGVHQHVARAHGAQRLQRRLRLPEPEAAAARPGGEERAVLRQEADARGIFLSDEAMDFILNRFSRDLGNLMQLLDQIDGYSLQTQRAITVPLIKSMLDNP
jgi:DnaA family protein